MKHGKNILKNTSVLLLLAVMLLSATAVTANTNPNKITLQSLGDSTNQGTPSTGQIIWDNNLTYGEALIACQYEPTYGELGSNADDFKLDTTQYINTVHWIGGFWNGYPAPFDWQITFYNDDGTGTKPGTVLAGPFLFLNADINEEFLEQIGTTYYYEWTAYLEEPVLCTGDVKYWIGFQGQGVYPPQSGMAVHTSPQQMNQCKFKSAFFGYPDWVDGSVVFGMIYDLAFQLFGWFIDDIPPVTTCNITGTNPVIVTLTATDEGGVGVYYTKYKLDTGAWTTYTAPVVVTAVGDHIVYYYSVDFVGNIEKEKNTSFTVEAPPITLTITIQGGFGVSATIKNTGTTNVSDIPWQIQVEGGILKQINKTVNGTIDIAANWTQSVGTGMFLGLGSITITVKVASEEKTATGLQFIIYSMVIK